MISVEVFQMKHWVIITGSSLDLHTSEWNKVFDTVLPPALYIQCYCWPVYPHKTSHGGNLLVWLRDLVSMNKCNSDGGWFPTLTVGFHVHVCTYCMCTHTCIHSTHSKNDAHYYIKSTCMHLTILVSSVCLLHLCFLMKIHGTVSALIPIL